jgi:hypothetical protein
MALTPISVSVFQVVRQFTFGTVADHTAYWIQMATEDVIRGPYPSLEKAMVAGRGYGFEPPPEQELRIVRDESASHGVLDGLVEADGTDASKEASDDRLHSYGSDGKRDQDRNHPTEGEGQYRQEAIPDPEALAGDSG